MVKIVNPITNRKVNINSKLGKKIIAKYLENYNKKGCGIKRKGSTLDTSTVRKYSPTKRTRINTRINKPDQFINYFFNY